MRPSDPFYGLAAFVAVSAGHAEAKTPPPVLDSAAMSGLGIRNIGSAVMSGRIAAVAARREKDGKVTIFAGTASGGIWKSSDDGTTFRPVFDRQPVQSIGALALDPSDPKIVWAGTGESWTRNSVSIGDGVYKSIDGGETWQNVGLPRSERIARILVHPRDGRIVYVCAPGALWSDSADRGVYKTSDGGRTWTRILSGENLSTGCSSVAMDPSDPDRLIAGLWDFRRKGWEARSGGEGPDAPSGSAMLVTEDGGKSWRPLTAETAPGLPKGPWGRIEITFAPTDPRLVYAFIESPRSALFVSEDGGRRWEERDRSRNMVWRPFYFARLVVDPNNPRRLFKTNANLIASDDAGRSFTNATGGALGDFHDLWIDPTNSKHVVAADDAGLLISDDGGIRWAKAFNLPVSQFYHVSIDEQDPYKVYGGLQDNANWRADSEYPGGISNSRWETIYAGGDGFWTFSDPADRNFAYAEWQGGRISRIDLRTLESRNIQPKADYGDRLRFNWNTPLAFSPHEKGALYMGAQYLFRTQDQGHTWQRLSPDLTTNDPMRQRQEKSGGITVDNSAAEMHTTIYSISESPRTRGLIWVGTDDGKVQLTRDDGKSWSDLTANLKLPAGNWISWVEASRHDPGSAYVAVDRHTFGDMRPYLYRTRDYGRTWTELIGPKTTSVRGYMHVVKEDRLDPGLLFAGTEFGLFVSIDGGVHWAQFSPENFPNVAVRDIALQERDDDLVLATHGRGIWIVDDISPLRELTPQRLASEVALIPSPPVQQRIRANGGWPEGDATFYGDNPPDGAVITYYQQKRPVIGRTKLEILDAAGAVVAELPASRRRGLNRVIWSMRTSPPAVPRAASLARYSTEGPRVLPGTYTVRLTRAGKPVTMPLKVTLDRRATFSVEDRQAQFAAAERIKRLFGRMSDLVSAIAKFRAREAGSGQPGSAGRSAAADALRKQLVATTEGGAITGEERLREKMDDVYGAVMSVEDAPTPYQIARIDALERELRDVEAAFQKLSQ